MGDGGFEVRRKIDDRDGLERASENTIVQNETRTGILVGTAKTHFLTQMPHPMQRNSEMNAILSVGFTSIQSLPEKTLFYVTIALQHTAVFDGSHRPIFTTGHDYFVEREEGGRGRGGERLIIRTDGPLLAR